MVGGFNGGGSQKEEYPTLKLESEDIQTLEGQQHGQNEEWDQKSSSIFKNGRREKNKRWCTGREIKISRLYYLLYASLTRIRVFNLPIRITVNFVATVLNSYKNLITNFQSVHMSSGHFYWAERIFIQHSTAVHLVGKPRKHSFRASSNHKLGNHAFEELGSVLVIDG